MATNSIGWGKCSIIVKDLGTDGALWTKLPTPKVDTTQLSTTKGDKLEAEIEGGENEDVKYKYSDYELAYTIRRNTSRVAFFDAVNGVVANKYAVFVQPENVNVPGVYMENTAVSVEDVFDTTDGGQWNVTHDGLTPDDGSNIVKWCTIDTDLSAVEEGATLATDPTFTNVDETTTATE